MKVILFVTTLLFLCVTFSYADVENVLTSADKAPIVAERSILKDENAPFVYESRVKNPISKEELANLLSGEYFYAKDEFSKRDVLNKIYPEIKQGLTDGKAISEYIVRVKTELGQYDFGKQRFPSGFTKTTFIPFKYQFATLYALMFDNVNTIEFFPVPIDEAKQLSEKLQQSRAITALIHVRITGTNIKKIYMANDTKILNSHITKVDFVSDGDKLIASVTPK